MHGLEAMRNARLLLATDIVGVFVGALNGALIACRRRDYDLVGVMSIALAAGLGGGLTRDTLIEQGPPLALRIDSYLFVAVCGGAVGFLFGLRLLSSRFAPQVDRAIRYSDALTLGNFAVSSTLLARNASLSVTACLLVGIVGATAGGVLRDVLLGDRVVVFVHGELYATAAAAASGVTLIGIVALHSSALVASAVGWMVGCGLRLGALAFSWKGPLPPGR
jgi:uncharacterized membrane protein YeiH